MNDDAERTCTQVRTINLGRSPLNPDRWRYARAHGAPTSFRLDTPDRKLERRRIVREMTMAVLLAHPGELDDPSPYTERLVLQLMATWGATAWPLWVRIQRAIARREARNEKARRALAIRRAKVQRLLDGER